MYEVLTMGEPMGLLAAEEEKQLKDVSRFTRYICGAEVNFCIGLARLGHIPAYVSRIGKDPFGQHIREYLGDSGIAEDYLWTDDTYLTGMQLKAKNAKGDPEVINYRHDTAFAHFKPEDLAKINWDGVRHVHLTGIPAALSMNCLTATELLMGMAHARNVRISFDPNLRPALWPDKAEMVTIINSLAQNADIVLPGINEGDILTGSRQPEKIADFYLERGVKTVVVKLGAEGAYVKTAHEKGFVVPGYPVKKVVDTVGAGDGFAVGVVSALLENEPLFDAVQRGAAIGALAVMSAGDNEGLPDRETLTEYMRKLH